MIFKTVRTLRTESDEMVLTNNYQDLQNKRANAKRDKERITQNYIISIEDIRLRKK